MSLIQRLISNLGTEENYALIQKIHGHFYYAKKINLINQAIETDIEAEKLMMLTLPTRLKKEGYECFIGDLIQVNPQNQTITEIIPRLSLMPRPKVANIDQALIIISVCEPAPEPEYLDRLLTHASLTLPDKPIICLTKVDLQKPAPEFINLYKSLGYKIIELSYLQPESLEELKTYLFNKVSVLAGQSGVGKSSLLTNLFPERAFKVGDVSKKSQKGTHTTRHTEMFEGRSGKNMFYILDTPGFSRLDAQVNLTEINSAKAFPEIAQSQEKCYFEDCKHLEENGCKINFSESRKASYQKLAQESIERESEQLESRKVKDAEDSTKKSSSVNINIPKLKSSDRSISRKKQKQSFNLNTEDSLNETENSEE